MKNNEQTCSSGKLKLIGIMTGIIIAVWAIESAATLAGANGQGIGNELYAGITKLGGYLGDGFAVGLLLVLCTPVAGIFACENIHNLFFGVQARKHNWIKVLFSFVVLSFMIWLIIFTESVL